MGQSNVQTGTGGAGGSGAPTTAQYVTLATDGTLSAERTLTAGANVKLTDAGANNTITVDVGTEALAFAGDISPTQLSANTNDWAPTGLATASTIRVSTDASRDLTGLTGGADGRVIVLHNVGAQNLVLKDESASSSAANRFALSGDRTLAGDSSCILQYDSTSSRWRIASGDPGAGGSGYVTIQDEGSGLTQRATLNFIGGSLTAADNAGSTRTDVTSIAGYLYDKVTGTTDIVSDATEQTVYSKSIAANDLGTDRRLVLRLYGDYLNNSGAGRTLQIKVKFGATTLFDDVSGTLGAAAVRLPVLITIHLNNKGATNSQVMTGEIRLGDQPATSGLGNVAQTQGASAGRIDEVIAGTSAEDTTGAKTLSVTVQHGASNASLSFRVLSAYLEMWA